MPLNLLDHKLVIVLYLLGTTTYDEVFVALQHGNRGVQGLNAIVIALVTVFLIPGQSVTLLALDDGITDCKFMRGKQDTRHEAAAMLAGYLLE